MIKSSLPPVLEIRDYGLQYMTARGTFQALSNIDLRIEKGEIHGLVGESGSGKTSLAWSVMRYLPGNAIEHDGAIRLAGEELSEKTPAEMQAIRGKRMSMVFQDPSTSLNPTLSLGRQLTEVLMTHRGLSRKQAWHEGIERLAQVGLKTPADMMNRMPHEVSGGEKQRLVIASAFACDPELIIFDEPTTALDVITSRQILDLLSELQQTTGVAALYISHDLSTVARIANKVSVILHGKIVEENDVENVFSNPQHDYTRRLIGAVPNPNKRLVQPLATSAEKPLAKAEAVTVSYGRTSFFSSLFGKGKETVVGNREVSLDIKPGEILGIVGESGSGKSTLAKAMIGLNPFSGKIWFDGKPITGRKDMDKAYRRDVQMIFQHPDASLNPRHKIREILSRPLDLYGLASGKEREPKLKELLEQVRLPGDYIDRYPHELSGGEKQRIAIARAFASAPKLVICDEITSALDVSVQASVVELLLELQRQHGTAYMFITHDLNLIRQIAHRIAVMYRGDLIEISGAEEISHPERAEYTRRLIEAIPMAASAGVATPTS